MFRSIEMRAESTRRQDHYLVSGRKFFINLSRPRAPRHRRITQFPIRLIFLAK
jgi:hypothetical protein